MDKTPRGTRTHKCFAIVRYRSKTPRGTPIEQSLWLVPAVWINVGPTLSGSLPREGTCRANPWGCRRARQPRLATRMRRDETTALRTSTGVRFIGMRVARRCLWEDSKRGMGAFCEALTSTRGDGYFRPARPTGGPAVPDSTPTRRSGARNETYLSAESY